jgi:hypothetical protein
MDSTHAKEAPMSPATESLVKKLALFATVTGLGSALAFLVVACGSMKMAQPRPTGWQMLPASPIQARGLNSVASAWTGKELVVLAVRPGPDGTFVNSTNLAAAYDPATRTWRRLAPSPKMQNYCRRGVASTGSQVVLWGCSAAALDPRANAWKMLPKAPTSEGFLAWTGAELIGWGGGCCGDAEDGGSAYDLAANSWRRLPRSPLAPSQGPLGAWTGHRLLVVVSGYSPDGKPYSARLARLASYDPATDTWRELAAPPAGALRYGGAAAWDGDELLVIGNESATKRVALAYDPSANRWRRLARPPHGLVPLQAFWTGSRMIVLGGGEATLAFAYDRKVDRWTALPRIPVQGPSQSAAWTGRQLIVWGSAGGAALTPAR